MHACIAQLRQTCGVLKATVLALLVSTCSSAISAEPGEGAESRVGMPTRIEQIVLPGPKLKARPLTDRDRPLVLRIEQSYPHGSDFRYDLVYYGLEPGEYDLRDYLQREDGSSAGDLSPLKVAVLSSLPAGQIEPNALQSGSVPRLGGYRVWVVIAGALWLAGLATILLVGRKVNIAKANRTDQRISLDEQLLGAIETIVSGRFTEADKSRLERLLLAFWRRHLGLEDADPEKAMAAMRANPGAAHLIGQLERWLHQPATLEQVDVTELLRPYQKALEQRRHAGGWRSPATARQTTGGGTR